MHSLSQASPSKKHLEIQLLFIKTTSKIIMTQSTEPAAAAPAPKKLGKATPETLT